MKWSHNDTWMVTGDHGGYIKYWQSNMNNVKMFQAHKDPVRCVSFSPTDAKFASCSDDGTVRVWDFFSCNEERVLRGHGSDVKCVDWHPTKVNTFLNKFFFVFATVLLNSVLLIFWNLGSSSLRIKR